MLFGRLSLWLCAVPIVCGQVPSRAQLFLAAQPSGTNLPAPGLVALGWNPSPDANADGCFLCWGLARDACTNLLDAGNSTTATVGGLAINVTYYFSVLAYDAAGDESVPSNEIAYTNTVPPDLVTIQAPTITLWGPVTTPQTYGSLILSATVTPSGASGTITFMDGAASLGAVPVINGTAAFRINLTVAGSPHAIQALFNDPLVVYASSSSSVSNLTITALATTTLLTSDINPSGLTTNVTFAATVTGVPPVADLPTGNMVFSTNGTPFATNGLISGSTTASTASLPAGATTMTAQYVGDGNFQPNSDSLAQAVTNSVICSQVHAIASLVNNGDGTFTLNLLGTPGASYYVVVSGDISAPLASWTALTGSTNTAPGPSGQWSIVVSNAAPAFFRSVAVNPAP
jgi:hypothetical protein